MWMRNFVVVVVFVVVVSVFVVFVVVAPERRNLSCCYCWTNQCLATTDPNRSPLSEIFYRLMPCAFQRRGGLSNQKH